MSMTNEYQYLSGDGLFRGKRKISSFNITITGVFETYYTSAPEAEGKKSYEVVFEPSGETAIIDSFLPKSWNNYCKYCCDAGMTSTQRKYLAEYLQMQAAEKEIQKLLVIDRAGWNDSFGRFVVYGDKLIGDVSSEYLWELDPKLKEQYHADIKYDIEDEELIQSIHKLMWINDGTSELLFYISLLGLIKEFLEKLECKIRFVTNLYGDSGAGKTTFATLFFCPLKKESGSYSCLDSFESITPKLIRGFAKYTGMNYCLDDFHPCETRARGEKQKEILEILIRYAGDSADFPNVIITGEYLDGSFSLQDRELQVYMPIFNNTKQLTELQQQSWILPTVQYRFLKSIMSNYESVKFDILQWKSRRTYAAYPECGNYRGNEYAEIILLVRELFNKYTLGTDNSILQESLLDTKLKEILNNQNALLKTRRKRTDAIELIWKVLPNKNILRPVYKKSDFHRNEMTVYIENEIYFVTAYALECALQKYLGNERGSIDVKRITDKLHEVGILSEYACKDGYTKKIGNIRCYAIDIKALQNCIETYNDAFGNN